MNKLFKLIYKNKNLIKYLKVVPNKVKMTSRKFKNILKLNIKISSK